MLKLLLTRAENEIAETTSILQAHAFEVLAYPITCLSFTPPTPFHPSDYQAILLTSRNSVRALEKWTPVRHLPLGVVGKNTAALAKQAGFSEVYEAGETVEELIKWVRATFDPEAKPLFYGRGEIIRHDLKKILERDQFCVEEKIFYTLQGIPNLPSCMVEFLRKKEIWGALFLSQFSAHHFQILVKKAGLEPLESVYFFGLSPTVLSPLKKWGRALLTPERPHFDSLIELLNATRHDNDPTK